MENHPTAAMLVRGTIRCPTMPRTRAAATAVIFAALLAGGCASVRPGDEAVSAGDEIMVCGRLIHTGAPVVRWTDARGYDAYRVNQRFAPSETRPSKPEAGTDTPNRYGIRPVAKLTKDDQDFIRDHGWDLPQLQQVVNKFVIHYDVCGTSRQCFKILQDVRGLSVHFMLDVDGTIYQTLDLKERARHSGPGNDASVGIEIAHIGAYNPDDPKDAAVLKTWYKPDDTGRLRVMLPAYLGNPHLRTPDFVARPAREEPIVGAIHGQRLMQYDFTDEQYRSLIKLAATLSRTFTNLKADAPRDAQGVVRTDALTAEELDAFGGFVGHYHLTRNKTDPGPAFDWERLVTGVRAELN